MSAREVDRSIGRETEIETTYRVALERDDSFWLITAEDVPGAHSYGRTIPQALENIREAIAVVEDLADWEDLSLKVELVDKDASRLLHSMTLARSLADDLADLSSYLTEAAIGHLRPSMSLRDIGALVGVSHQRVAQIWSREAASTWTTHNRDDVATKLRHIHELERELVGQLASSSSSPPVA